MTPGEMVREFHESFGARIGNTRNPNLGRVDTQELRWKLIAEEVKELADAFYCQNIVEVADALADIAYVTYGAAIAFGIDLDACIAEVHRSNMSKLGADGSPVFREDGKVLKGPNYSPPNLQEVLGL
jgi:predicted HAD superfamily Cof-like phosphohydrolase